MVSMDIKKEGLEEVPGSYDCCPVIHLNDDQVEALGIKGIPVPGTGVRLVCMAVVQSVRAEAEEADEKEKPSGPDVYLTLKITDMEATQPTKPSDMAAGLYK